MRWLLLTLLAAGAFLVVRYARLAKRPIAGEWLLCTYCPPGFERTDDNRCALRSLYQLYASDTGVDVGVGGLKTALPDVRDGFSPQQIDLGRYLFFDPVLSVDNTISCATCHNPARGFSDGLPTSVGVGNAPLTRSAPTLWNVAFLKRLFWDARATSLEEQMQGPLFSPLEMGTNPSLLLETLNGIPAYRSLFSQAFPDQESPGITLDQVYTAIAAFESTLISLNSRYDQYAHGYHEALTEYELEGLNIFRSFVARCTECHTPPLFTNQQLAVIGLGEPDGKPFDPGAETTFHDKTLRGAFKVPSLRNIEKTAPYTHAGRFETLRAAVEFYTKGRGHDVPATEKLYIHWHIWEPRLSDHELDRLVDFLRTLTDEQFLPQVPEKNPSGLMPRNPAITLNEFHQLTP